MTSKFIVFIYKKKYIYREEEEEEEIYSAR